MTSTARKDKDGNIEWRNEKGWLHRENGPAVEWVDGSKEWYLNGQCHRENGPAVKWENGGVDYFLNGKTSLEIKQQVKENMARTQQQELIDVLSQNQDISDKINTSSSVKRPKKL